MKRMFMYFFISFLALIVLGPVSSLASPPSHVKDNVKEKQAIKDQEQDIANIGQEEGEMDQEEDMEGDIPNTSKIGHVGQAGKSHIGHMYLFEKNQDTWDIVEDGAWGKMRYTVKGPNFDFVFNGHDLEPETNYTLIYYPDPYPGEGLICLGDSTTNEEGDVHIMGSPDTGDLPKSYDKNSNTKPTSLEKVGAKIWLVLSEDVDCNCDSNNGNCKMYGWNPTEYLFEYDVINYDDTDTSENISSDIGSETEDNKSSGNIPAIISSDLNIFIPEAQISDKSVSFKLEYWKNPKDKDGIYFKLDKDSLTIDEE